MHILYSETTLSLPKTSLWNTIGANRSVKILNLEGDCSLCNFNGSRESSWIKLQQKRIFQWQMRTKYLDTLLKKRIRSLKNVFLSTSFTSTSVFQIPIPIWRSWSLSQTEVSSKSKFIKSATRLSFTTPDFRNRLKKDLSRTLKELYKLWISGPEFWKTVRKDQKSSAIEIINFSFASKSLSDKAATIRLYRSVGFCFFRKTKK